MMWRPITDLPDVWKNRSSPELISLVTVWEEQAGRLRQSGAFKTYMDRLRREIAIETGIIERLYSLDRGVTQLLIEHGIDEALIPYGATDRPVQQVVALIKDQEAAWLHHRFTQIHPFQDGNGRVARLLASLVFIKAGWFPLILTRDDRSNYISALEEADRGNLTHLVELFTDRQKRAFIRSLGLSV